MGLPKLEYYRARTLEEAIALGAENQGARYLAGGTDLLPLMRCGTGECLDSEATRVIDIKNVTGLGEITEIGSGLSIGATATVSEVAVHPSVCERYPVLVECCLSLGSYPLRNIATVAGNICNGSPCADTAAALLVLDATVQTAGPDGTRQISIHDFFRGPGETSLQPGELVTAILLDSKSAGARGHYGRIARRQAVDISTVAVLVALLPDARPRYRIAVLSAAPTPLRIPEAEELLHRQGPPAADGAAELAMAACSPITDVRGSAEYRREMVGVLTRRGVQALTGGN